MKSAVCCNTATAIATTSGFEGELGIIGKYPMRETGIMELLPSSAKYLKSGSVKLSGNCTARNFVGKSRQTAQDRKMGAMETLPSPRVISSLKEEGSMQRFLFKVTFSKDSLPKSDFDNARLLHRERDRTTEADDVPTSIRSFEGWMAIMVVTWDDVPSTVCS